MLAQAEQRVHAHGWDNVSLVQTDALELEYPTRVDAILSTYALGLVPEADAIIARGAAALAPGGRWVVLDLSLPPTVPGWVAHAAIPLVRPFGATEEVMARRTWEVIQRAMHEHLDDFSSTDLFFGFIFLATGAAPT